MWNICLCIEHLENCSGSCEHHWARIATSTKFALKTITSICRHFSLSLLRIVNILRNISNVKLFDIVEFIKRQNTQISMFCDRQCKLTAFFKNVFSPCSDGSKTGKEPMGSRQLPKRRLLPASSWFLTLIWIVACLMWNWSSTRRTSTYQQTLHSVASQSELMRCGLWNRDNL